MALAPGARLGPYEIVSPAGAGGMGEVYRARDVDPTGAPLVMTDLRRALVRRPSPPPDYSGGCDTRITTVPAMKS
jgi:hypothetical protein